MYVVLAMQKKRSLLGNGGRRGRCWRTLVSAMAAFAVFLSLFHCVSAEAKAATFERPMMVGSLVAMSSDMPDQQQPGHAGHCSHCLCHAAYQDVADGDSLSIVFAAPTYDALRGHLIRAVAGLPPFKPPRA